MRWRPDHVLACLVGPADNPIEPSSALLALELTVQVHRHHIQPAG
ncbi:MAG: hypothetical protein ACRDOB_02850 [Streptosporangiaceae bacterium]